MYMSMYVRAARQQPLRCCWSRACECPRVCARPPVCLCVRELLSANAFNDIDIDIHR